METLEEEACRYVIKKRLTKPLLAAIAGPCPESLEAVGRGRAETAELRFKAQAWKRHRRVIVVRRRIEDSAQEDLWGMEGYEFSAYVTTLRWRAVDVVTCYNHRGTAENCIKESKAGFGIDQIPTGEFYPKAAALILKLTAYNLVLRFQSALGGGPKAAVRRTATTFRRGFITLPGQLICRSGRWILKLPEGFPQEEKWTRLRTRLALT